MSDPQTPARILLLGGTSEARDLAQRLATRAGLKTVLSLAGRTAAPAPQPVPTRHGGFGGADGLAAYLAAERIDLLVDATHPFAARISANAAEAARRTGVPLLRLHRPPWTPRAGDRWQGVASTAAAVAALPAAPHRVFLAIGRQEVAAFEAAPQHAYLVRSVDPVSPPPALPRMTAVLARGPFAPAAERALLQAHGIEIVVCKNSGGAATGGKLAAARELGLPVVMVGRPADPHGVPSVETVEAAWAAIAHALGTVVPRGV